MSANAVSLAVGINNELMPGVPQTGTGKSFAHTFLPVHLNPAILGPPQ